MPCAGRYPVDQYERLSDWPDFCDDLKSALGGVAKSQVSLKPIAQGFDIKGTG